MRVVVLALLVFVPLPLNAGQITYDIVDYSTDPNGRVVAMGTKTQVPMDVQRAQRGSLMNPLWVKSIELDRGVFIGLVEASSREDVLTGFGMWVETRWNRRGWDLFYLSGGNVYAKFIESGFVRVATVDGEIVSIAFITDLSLTQISGRTLVTPVNIPFITDISLTPTDTATGRRVLTRANVPFITDRGDRMFEHVETRVNIYKGSVLDVLP